MSENEVRRSAVPRPGLFYGYIVVICSFIVIMAAFGVRYSFGIFFLPMLNEFGWTRAMTSGAFSLSVAMEGIFSIITGILTDRFGSRVVITLCGILLGLGYLLMSQVNAVWQLYLFYGVIIGIGMGGIMVTSLSTVARWFDERRGMMSGAILTGTGVGALVAAPVANQLISAYDWRISFLILGGLILIVIVSAAQFLKRDPARMGLLPYGGNGGHGLPKVETRGFSFSQAVRTRSFWLIVGMDFFYGVFEFAIIVHIAPHASGLGFAGTTAAAIVATLGGFQIVGRIVLGSTADRIGSRKAFMIGFALTTVVLFALVPVREVWMLFLLAAAFGMAAGGIGSMVSPVVADFFGLGSHGFIFGFTAFAFTVGAAIGPFMAGYVFDVTGNYQIAFMGCGGAGIIGFVLALLLKPRKAVADKASGLAGSSITQ